MAVSYSANAVLAKARAIYGKRLKKQNYIDLMACHSFSELITYLKTHTDYASTFETAPITIGSEQIEELLRMYQLEKIEAICRYEISTGEDFYEYFIRKIDIAQILTFIRLLINGNPEKYLTTLPPFFNKHTELNLYEIAKSKNYNELLNALDGSPYKKILEPFASNYSDKNIYIKIESELNSFLRHSLVNIVNHGTNKSGQEQIHQIVNYRFDMETIINIYRLIRLQDADNSIIRNYICTDFTNFSSKEIDMLISAPVARNMIGLISKTCYRNDFSKVDFNYLEGAVQKMLYSKLAKTIRYDTDPTAVMLSYMALADNEIQNIVHIVEGIKYDIPPTKISAFLVGMDN